MNRQISGDFGDSSHDAVYQEGHDDIGYEDESWTAEGESRTRTDEETGSCVSSAISFPVRRASLPSTNGTTKSNHLSMSALETTFGNAVSLIEKVRGDDGLGHRGFPAVQRALAISLISGVTFDFISCRALFRVVVFAGRHGVVKKLQASAQLEGAEAAAQYYCLGCRTSSCRSERDKKEKEGSGMAGERGMGEPFLTLFRQCILEIWINTGYASVLRR